MAVLYCVHIIAAFILQVVLYFALFPAQGHKVAPVEPGHLLFHGGVLLLTLAVQWSFLFFYRRGRYLTSFYRWIKNFNAPRFTPAQIIIVALAPLLLFVGYLFFNSWNKQEVSWAIFWSFTWFFLARAAFEELMFRGFLFRTLLKRYRRHIIFVIIAQAAFFALLHNPNPDANLIRLFNIFLGGAFLGLVAMRSFLAATLFHFAWNFLPGFILGTTVSGYEFQSSLLEANETLIAWEDHPASIAVFMAAIGALYLYERKKQEVHLS